MPHCPSYDEMAELDNLMNEIDAKGLQQLSQLSLNHVRLIKALIADNRQMRKHLQKLKSRPTPQL